MAKVYLKMYESNGICQDCYFINYSNHCLRPDSVPKCRFKFKYHKITEEEAKYLLENGWRKFNAL